MGIKNQFPMTKSTFKGISILVQWLSQDFKGHLDIDYIWVFISFYDHTGIEGPRKPNLFFPSDGQIFLSWVKDAASVASSKKLSKNETIVQT